MSSITDWSSGSFLSHCMLVHGCHEVGIHIVVWPCLIKWEEVIITIICVTESLVGSLQIGTVAAADLGHIALSSEY